VIPDIADRYDAFLERQEAADFATCPICGQDIWLRDLSSWVAAGVHILHRTCAYGDTKPWDELSEEEQRADLYWQAVDYWTDCIRNT
jgi:hypothetical protein